ncbi:MAG TPA: winged helix-turn-helix domain-containing protein [Bryobacteraceae bacterium]|nr:winged helix-turn-helix domain-containing protein [Bryobacteraceae bacterium]
MELPTAPIYLFEEIRVDASRLKVERECRPVTLEPKALRVLLYLIEHRTRVVPKDELIAVVWQGAFVTDNAVTRVIAQIRKQLGDQARSPRLIETAATAGYRFIAPVTEQAGAGAQSAAGHVSQPAYPARPLAALALGFATLALLMWWTRRAPASVGSPLLRIEQITSSAAADLWPSFSPDGKELAFSSNRTGHFEIYTRALAGGADRQITTDCQDCIQPAWSPEGRYLAFVSKVRGGIGLIPAAGGSARYLTDSGSDPHWSPDGRNLVYRSTNLKTVREAGSWNSYLLLVDRDGSAPRTLTRPGSPRGGHNYPRWLPDGRHVMFAAPGEHASQAAWVVDTKGGSVERMVEMGMNTVAYPSFTKDSSYLYFIGGGLREPMGLWRARVAPNWTAQTPEAVSPATVAWPRDLTITADGSRIAFSQEIPQSAIWTVPIDPSGRETGKPVAITQGHSFRDSNPMFSPDGSRLAFTSARQGGNALVYVANADGSAPRPISAAENNSWDPAWLGKELACGFATSARHGGATYVLAFLDGRAKAVKLKMDLDRASRLRISPDGTRLVAHIGTPDNFQVVVEDLQRGTVREVTPPGRSIGFPAWSPDGRWIAAQERVQDATRLVILPAEGGEIRTLVSDPGESWANSWSPDGDRIAFAGLRDGVWNIFWVSRTTGAVHQLTHFTSQSEFVRYPTWSPRNNQVAFEYNALEANVYVADVR